MPSAPLADSIPTRLLLGPGPSPVSDRVLKALAAPTLGHLDPFFLKIMDEVRRNLQEIYRTTNEMTLAVSGTGSAGMETVLANLVEPGDTALVCVNGVFGGRMVDVAQRCRAVVSTLEAEWGRGFDQDRILDEVRNTKPKMVGVVHAETSTGVRQDVDRLAETVHAYGGLLLLDCVTSLAGLPVEIDAWGVDAAYSGTQKCLSCPPGLSPVTLSPRAVAKLDARRGKVQSWYLDLSMVRNYWGGDRAYHHTAPTNMLVGFAEALRIVLEEGIDARFERHRRAHETLKAELAAMGITYASDPERTLPMLNCVRIPEGVRDEAAVRRTLLEKHAIEIGGGLGPLKGKVWRIGLMGHGATDDNARRVAGALRESLA